jgi:hypothetical protein
MWGCVDVWMCGCELPNQTSNIPTSQLAREVHAVKRQINLRLRGGRVDRLVRRGTARVARAGI